MSALRQNAITMLEALPENQLIFIVNIMKELSRLMPQEDMGKTEIGSNDAREQAFAVLENLRRKVPDLDYEKELAEYREARYL